MEFFRCLGFAHEYQEKIASEYIFWTSYRANWIIQKTELTFYLQREKEENCTHEISAHLVNCAMIVCAFRVHTVCSSNSKQTVVRYLCCVLPYLIQPACWWKLLIWSDFQLCDEFLQHSFHFFLEKRKEMMWCDVMWWQSGERSTGERGRNENHKYFRKKHSTTEKINWWTMRRATWSQN